MEETEDNVIEFPVVNKRLDMSQIPVEPEEVMEKIRRMKKAYFAEVSDVILDDVLRSIGCLDLKNSKQDTYNPDSLDLIMIKESIIATMCRIVGMDHPLHEIGAEELIQKDESQIDDYHTYYSYKFRSEADSDEDETLLLQAEEPS